MYISAEDWRRGAFRAWARTGTWPNTPAAGRFDVKYNHRHDPRTGQFTFRYAGESDGSPKEHFRPRGGSMGGGEPSGSSLVTGGGGDFGGGGASGMWRNPRRAIDRPARATESTARPTAPNLPQTLSAIVSPRQIPSAGRWIDRNGYRFRIDDDGRMREATGDDLRMRQAEPRSRTLQRQAGGADRLPTDDGGHYIAPRFNGPREAFNHFAQDANFNRGRYRVLEDQLAKLKRQGKIVPIRISPHFQGASKRPYEIDVVFWIDGHQKSVKFPNGPRKSGHD